MRKLQVGLVVLCVSSLFNIEVTRGMVTIRQQDFPTTRFFGGDIHRGSTLVTIYDGSDDGHGEKRHIPIGGVLQTPYSVEVFYGAMSWNTAKTKNIDPPLVVVVSFKKAVRKDQLLLGMFMSQRRKIMLYNPPAFSPWHLPGGISQLTPVLRGKGNEVNQRFGHIIGAEYVLKTYGGQEIANALHAIRSPNSTIHELYNARMTFERVSTGIPTKDKFRVERNNVIYQSVYQNGTISGALEVIRNRESNLWYPYFTQVELPVIRDFQPQVYGISVGDERQLFPALVLASLIKDTTPDCLVVLGGNFWSRIFGSYSIPEFARLFDYFDAIVYREGFQPLSELAATLKPSQASGVVWRDGGRLVMNQATEELTEFETLPTPDIEGGAQQWSLDIVPSLYTMSNCPMACKFCAISAGSDSFLGKPRTMSPERIAQHMAHLGATRYDICDETMPISRQLALGKYLKQIGHAATWQCYLTVNNQLMNPDVCHQLYEAGCRAVQLGLESMSPDILKQEDKQWNTPKNYGRILRNLRAAGIQTHGFIIAGIPSEPLHANLKWLPFFEDYGDSILTIKSGRYRLIRMSPEETLGLHSGMIEVLPDVKPLSLNRDFKYRNFALRKIDGVRDILEQMCRRHWAYNVTSTIPWWVNRGRYSWGELEQMAKVLPPEPEVNHLPEQVAQMRTIIRTELNRDANFHTFADLSGFARTIL